jgi:hypothetical protein
MKLILALFTTGHMLMPQIKLALSDHAVQIVNSETLEWPANDVYLGPPLHSSQRPRARLSKQVTYRLNYLP